MLAFLKSPLNGQKPPVIWQKSSEKRTVTKITQPGGSRAERQHDKKRGQTTTNKKRIEEIRRRIADLEEIKQIEESEEPVKWRLLFVIYVELEELQEELEQLLNAADRRKRTPSEPRRTAADPDTNAIVFKHDGQRLIIELEQRANKEKKQAQCYKSIVIRH